MDFRTFILAALGSFLAVTAILFMKPAHADWVASNGNDSVRLFEKPCANEVVLGLLDPGLHEHYQAATATVSGAKFDGCWRMTPNGAHLQYEDGDQGLVPTSDLKRPMDA